MEDGRQTEAARHVTAKVVVSMTEVEYATWRRAWWPVMVDSIVSTPADPPGWHRRETTEEGYPLMGSSPAERAEARERGERLRHAAMRDHVFVGDQRHCRAWSSPLVAGNEATGVITMRTMCGYPPDCHPDEQERPEPLALMDAGEGLLW